MARFIKLTRGTGGEALIPVDKILSCDRDDKVRGSGDLVGQTIVYLAGGEKRYVKETPEQILALIAPSPQKGGE